MDMNIHSQERGNIRVASAAGLYFTRVIFNTRVASVVAHVSKLAITRGHHGYSLGENSTWL